jgi:hypothetical protein
MGAMFSKMTASLRRASGIAAAAPPAAPTPPAPPQFLGYASAPASAAAAEAEEEDDVFDFGVAPVSLEAFSHGGAAAAPAPPPQDTAPVAAAAQGAFSYAVPALASLSPRAALHKQTEDMRAALREKQLQAQQGRG